MNLSIIIATPPLNINKRDLHIHQSECNNQVIEEML